MEVVACPSDGSAPEVAIPGRVSYASSTRLEVELAAPGDTRGFAGAPILSLATGRAVGILQTIQVSGGRALVRATPAEAVAPKLKQAEAAGAPLPFSTWKI